MIRILGTVFAGLLGLAFGSFLNVCLSRWPAEESIVRPGSHCRNCGHVLAWWENVPLVSWLALKGRCRSCRTTIGWRYPLVELAVGALWAGTIWATIPSLADATIPSFYFYETAAAAIGRMIFYFLLVALAILDAEALWLPNSLTLPGIAIGFAFTTLTPVLRNLVPRELHKFTVGFEIGLKLPNEFIGTLAAALVILIVRWLYKIIRHREGIGLGDAKLMAMLAAWLGLPGALLALFLAAIFGSLIALGLLLLPSARRGSGSWATSKLPLGTFLCLGGIASSLWGQPILAAYLRWAGF